MMREAPDSAGSLFREGKLAAAIEAANAAVRRTPGDLGARILLAELLLFAGKLERADVILEAAGQSDPASAVAVAEFRQLLQAETARRQLRRDGRNPEFLSEPSPALRMQLTAHAALRAGDLAASARLAHEAESLRPRAPGCGNGVAFDDFRDADDLTAGYFEVLTRTGKYYWIPTERVASFICHVPKRPRDLAWRRASMVITDGPEGDVFIPATYPWDDVAPDDQLLLGRATDWRKEQDLVCGVGQRTFLVGDTAIGAMELKEVRFEGSGACA